ncbi:GNAT family N-acetyltransferase [Salinispora mooreana]|uniref:GNAT family N-acetyltransferase n=1 Tax=Salinispora mooreana TaxID=999545 RepID=UPI0003823F9A|nr:GNAT family N-acetyltransferase [Salinispora mooreana]
MTVTLRPGRADDLLAVGALHQRSRAAAYAPFLTTETLAEPTPAALGQYWHERWSHERADHLLTVAERDSQLVGFSYLGPDDQRDPATGLLHAVHLEPAERGRGLGRMLMAAALAEMRARGWRVAALWVLRQNGPARRFYEQGGWRPTGVTEEELVGSTPAVLLRYRREL